jgi:pSer/pThr/pTyr-binding forkhead associated (FHA) protein
MRDGLTRELPHSDGSAGSDEYLSDFVAKLVIVAGGAVGTEFVLESECVTLGRGPSVDLAFDDPAMSRQHAAVELVDGQFRVRDLGSTNGVLLNGQPVQVGEFDNGDRMAIGSHEFQLVVEAREPEPDTYELPPV